MNLICWLLGHDFIYSNPITYKHKITDTTLVRFSTRTCTRCSRVERCDRLDLVNGEEYTDWKRVK